MKFTKNFAASAALSLALGLTACAESSHPSDHSRSPDIETASVGAAPNAATPDTTAHVGHEMHQAGDSTRTDAGHEPAAADTEKPISVVSQEVEAPAPSATNEGATDAEAAPAAPKMQMSVKTSITDRETVDGELSSIDLTFGHEMRLAGATLSTMTGESIPVEFDSKAFNERTSVRFETLQADDYTFTWRADAGDHEMSGTLRFSVER